MRYEKPTRQAIEIDQDYVRKCLANAVFYDHDELKSSHLLQLFKAKYIVFMDFNHPEFGITPGRAKQAQVYAKNSLRELLKDGYITMEKVEGIFMSKPTQKLCDEDEFPIGWEIKQLES